MWAFSPRSRSWTIVPLRFSAVLWAIFHARSDSGGRSNVVSDRKYRLAKLPVTRRTQSLSKKICRPA